MQSGPVGTISKKDIKRVSEIKRDPRAGRGKGNMPNIGICLKTDCVNRDIQCNECRHFNQYRMTNG